MNSQSSGRNQRPKGFKVRWALQFALVLAVCIWMLYQMKHSPGKSKDYSSIIQSKLSKEHSALNLGRKADLGWSSTEGESGSNNVDLVEEGEKKEDGGARDDELDRNVEENVEEESYNKDGDSHSQVGVKQASLSEDMIEEEHFNDRHDDQGDEKGLQTQVKTSNNAEKNHTGGLMQGKDEMEDGVHGFHDENGVHGFHDENGVHGFHDENGVPLDIVIPTESSRNQTMLSTNNQSRSIESTRSEGEEIKYKEGSNIVDSETESRSNQEDSKNEKTANGNVDSDTSVVSGINDASETADGKSTVSEDLSSVSSQQKQEEVTDTDIFLQAE